MAQIRIGRNYRSHITNEQVVSNLTEALFRLAAQGTYDQAVKRGKEIAKAMTAAGNRELAKIGDFMATSLMGFPSRTAGYTARRAVREYQQSRMSPEQREASEKSARSVVVPSQLFRKGMPDVTKSFRVPANSFWSMSKLPQGGLEWTPLSLKTERNKKRLGRSKPSGFFTDTLALQSYFKQNASTLIMDKTGGVEVTFNAEGLKLPKGSTISSYREIIGQIQVRVAPKKITAYNLPGLASGNWTDVNQKLTLERSMFPRSVTTKLGAGKTRGANPPWFRPLVQPTLAFWLLHRVPRALAVALSKTISRQTRGERGGSADTFSAGGK